MSKAMSYSTSVNKSAIKDNKPFKMTSSVSERIKQKLMTDEDTQKAIEDVIAKSQLLFCQTMNIK
ncbi:hypothetical protein BCU84_12875 [Shewanella sp. 10N.286.51.B7]|uniref:hypothetical protein n=1 Tax=Shewanella sp. 10N.286.51.B7 TaxID=1880836 RepID=UPI000C83E2C7|nr:hypothetical protein [Shewanella sp. 10N.286.51.B7]PMG76663.1 hypothetical protein BCU84_12875 [Shewanella sp. 10N.286.51.B7]